MARALRMMAIVKNFRSNLFVPHHVFKGEYGAKTCEIAGKSMFECKSEKNSCQRDDRGPNESHPSSIVLTDEAEPSDFLSTQERTRISGTFFQRKAKPIDVAKNVATSLRR